METRKKIAVYTLGCRANQFDSESVFAEFKARGFERSEEFSSADVHLINTCTVTNMGDRKSRQLIKKVVRQNKNSKIIATGCSAQQDADKLLELGVDLVVDNANKNELYRYYKNNKVPEKIVGNIFRVRELNQIPIAEFGGKSRAHLKIQDGCNQYCTYCIIPFVRGRSRSLPSALVLEQMQVLLLNGYKEIVLTGIHVGHYQADNLNFASLLKKILDIPGDFRIRLSSIEPLEINREVLELFREYPDKLCRFLHVAIQSASTSVLKRMRRGYNREYLEGLFNQLNGIDTSFGIGLDVITGFPGEDEKEFNDTVNFISGIPVSYGHVFRFSAKKGTPAARYSGQVAERVKKNRSEIIRNVITRRQNNFLKSQFNTIQSVVWESEDSGSTGNFTHVKSLTKSGIPGTVQRVKLENSFNQNAEDKFPYVSAVPLI